MREAGWWEKLIIKLNAVEGITSPDGRILGKMGHSERVGTNVAKNIEGNKDQKLFEAGVSYFT